MHELEKALSEIGLSWDDVWALSLDRRAGTLVVVAADGRKLVGRLGTAPRPPARRPRKPGQS
ncbi:MAG: hypothetical protein DCC51_15985 [Anaerolineae bacterium]|nr:MAG: hypothetical protein DCC51_15985 [Anaerolineae bacterium]